jgi:hypothetical protein
MVVHIPLLDAYSTVAINALLCYNVLNIQVNGEKQSRQCYILIYLYNKIVVGEVIATG